MNPENPVPAAQPNSVVPSFIERSHEAGRRPGDQLAGADDPVDLVLANPPGRSASMRRAQDQLRHQEATRQAAILDALPAHVALLDAQGIIVSVNAMWCRFADANRLHSPGHGVGVDYIAVCERAGGDDALLAQQAARGIRSVLADAQTSFSLEYACHSPTEQRWFLMTATPLPSDALQGAVVMHLNITERKRAESAFDELSRETGRRERMLSTMLTSIKDPTYIFDRTGCLLYANQPLLTLWERTLESVVGKNLHELGYPDELAFRLQRQVQHVVETRQSVTDESPYTSPAGVKNYYEYILSPVTADDGSVELVAGSSRDVTERSQAQARIVRLNRVYAVLSGISALIVRVRDRDELFRDACRIAVDAGGFKVAWIGVLEPPSLDGRVVASYGCEQDFIDQSQLTVRGGTSDNERPAGRALRLGRPVICNDIAAEPSLAALKDELLGRGYQALGNFALTVAGQPQAVFALFAGEAGFFDDEETALLVELAANLSFAMDKLEQQKRLEHLDAQRTLDEQALRRFSAAMDATADAIYLVDRSSMRVIHVNDAACRMQGQTRKQLLALGPAELLSTSHAELELTYDALIASSTNAAPLELLRQRQDGSQAWVELRRHALRSDQRWTIVTLVRDITERKQAQATLAEQLAELRRWNDVTMGREVRILDLKQEVNELLVQAGHPPRYPSAES